MTKLLAVASLVLFFAPVAIGQSLNTSVTGYVGQQVLCTQNGSSKATCARLYQEDPNVSAGVSMLAAADYGVLTASSGAVDNCGTGCEISAAATAGAWFNDSATLQGVPSSGAFFLITLDVSGSVSDPNATTSNFVLSIYDAQHTANCPAVLTPNAHRVCYLSVTDGDTVYFNATLGNSATANLVVAGGGNGTLTEFAIVSARISELAVVNQQRQVLNTVIITTASGHQYPL